MKKEAAKIIVPHKNNPGWYCVKTEFRNNGSITSDFIRDEETGVPITLDIQEKPLDGVYEDAQATTYFTYHYSYEEAFGQIQQSLSIITLPLTFFTLNIFLNLKS